MMSAISISYAAELSGSVDKIADGGGIIPMADDRFLDKLDMSRHAVLMKTKVFADCCVPLDFSRRLRL